MNQKFLHVCTLALLATGCAADGGSDLEQPRARGDAFGSVGGQSDVVMPSSVGTVVERATGTDVDFEIERMLNHVAPQRWARTPSVEVGDSEVLDLVAGLGFDESTAVFVEGGDIIRVEGDTLLEREALILGEYSPAERDDGGLIQKGYRNKNLVTSANARNIDIDMDGSYFPQAYLNPTLIQYLALFWISVAESAMADWNAVPNSVVDMRSDRESSLSNITIHFVPSMFWDTTPCSSSTPGCQFFPSNGRPARDVWIKADHPTNVCSSGWDETYALRVVVHELSHAVGLAHPVLTNSTETQWIEDTEECVPEDGWPCSLVAGYPTVMVGLFPGVCTTGIYRLTADDRDSAAKLY